MSSFDSSSPHPSSLSELQLTEQKEPSLYAATARLASMSSSNLHQQDQSASLDHGKAQLDHHHQDDSCVIIAIDNPAFTTTPYEAERSKHSSDLGRKKQPAEVDQKLAKNDTITESLMPEIVRKFTVKEVRTIYI